MRRAYAFGQRHALALLCLALGMYNLSNALNPETLPGWVFILIGAGNLYVAGWSMATRICFDREAQWRSDLSKLIDSIIADGERQLELERNKNVD